MSKQSLRDLIYVNGKEHYDQCFYSYGIEFYEFMSCVPHRPENLILLKHQFEDARRNIHSGFDYVTSQEIDGLTEDDVYGYGDFCWVDVQKEEDLDRLTKLQIAELLTFAHLAEPLHVTPKARFAYYAHDDGWFNKLYVSDLEAGIQFPITVIGHYLDMDKVYDCSDEVTEDKAWLSYTNREWT